MSFDIAESIRCHGFKRLLLAVSGGLDSICLAHYFIENQEAFGIEWLGIAHVHHGLREGTADRDAEFVEAFAKSHGVPFFLKKLDGEALKAAEGSLEENARDARYKALVEIASTNATKKCMDPRRSLPQPPCRGEDDVNNGDPGTESGMTNCNQNEKIAIVTAHHAGDQAETMFMRLKRGTTLAGLRGIQEIREIFSTPKNSTGSFATTPLRMTMREKNSFVSRLSSVVYIFRPFLSVPRKELLEYAHEHSLSWCEDESNTDVKFARNSIRHQLLPHLEKEVPGATRQLCRIAELADKAYAKVIGKCDMIFSQSLQDKMAIPAQGRDDNSREDDKQNGDSGTEAGMTCLKLDKKKLNKILAAHRESDLSELFRLWLSEKGFRFPIGFFYAPKEPAHVKIPVRTVYRKRSIVKIRHTVWICEFKDALSAAKFVSCEMKEKDYNEST